MSFDGYTLRCLIDELNTELSGSRIEKIYQPANDLLVINLRTKRGKDRLLISANPSNPRMHLTEDYQFSAGHPPMFCMLMRKHFQNGIIASISQEGLDRVVIISVRATDELGTTATKHIVVEIMGRHSNIILLDNNRIIIDAAKRVSPEMSSYRQLHPGILYKSPPGQHKLNMLTNSSEALKQKLLECNGLSAEKAILNSLEGIGKLLATEICYRSGIEPDAWLDSNNICRLLDTTETFRAVIFQSDYSPVIYYKSGRPQYFSAVLLTHLNLDSVKHDNVNRMVDSFFSEKLRREQLTQAKDGLERLVRGFLEKNMKKMANQQEEYDNAQDYGVYRLYGELLTANLFRLKEKADRAIVQNFYDADAKEIEIPLNPNLTPSENAQRFFREYGRKKRTVENLSSHIENTKNEIQYLESLLFNIEKSTDMEMLAEIRSELLREGLIKDRDAKSGEKTPERSKPLRFISCDGLDIFVGKNNYQNDYLTLKLAARDDLWLHTKDIPGSHVVIKAGNSEVPVSTLHQGAMLAAFFSKGRHSSNVPVDYTEVKNVNKPSGAKPGMVVYRNNRTLFVTPDEELVNAIKRVE
ncbi:MAG: Fibronectin/fibrinogen-binding protein [Firmicutes bacterium]|nr:Fibronectin/fibrinogen-binding protein [Bacillota bacterium]MDI6705463.1 NFACT RNA binding domain-containing protein [Bacillota bacterium]